MARAMSAPPYMRFYWGDYFRDTRRLNRLEHSAYLLLLGELWVQGGKLPADDETLARATLCTPDEWAQVKPAVMSFFTIRRGSISQKRLAQELSHAVSVSEARKQAGKSGGMASAGKPKGKRTANAAPNGEANEQRNLAKPEPEPERYSDTNVSGAEAPGLPLGDAPEPTRTDPDRHAWNEAVRLLKEQGGLTDAKARSFFGRLLKDTGLQAKDMLGSLATALANQTGDPQGYLTRAAQAVAKRRAPSLEIHPRTGLPIEPSWGG